MGQRSGACAVNPTDALDAEVTRTSDVVWHIKSPLRLKEEPLQRLIEQRPDLLPSVDRAPAAVAAELKVPKSGRADVVVVDRVGGITIVETKLATNADFRGVLSQVLSYAGGLWGLDYDQFNDRFAGARRTTGLTAPFAAENEGWEEAFREKVGEHLKTGTFNLIIALNVVTVELVQTVEFINAQTSEHLRLSVLVCGESAEPVRHVPRPDDKTPEKLVAGIGARDARAGEAAEILLGWIREQGLVMNCDNGKDGVVNTSAGVKIFRINGHEEMVRVSLRKLRAGGLDDERIGQLVEKLNALGFRANERRSKASLAALAEADAVFGFTELMEGVIEEL